MNGSACRICKFSNIFGGVPGGEPWLTCGSCSARIHIQCLRNAGGSSHICNCAIDNLLQLELQNIFHVSDYKWLNENQASYENMIRFPRRIPHALMWRVEQIRAFLEKVGLDNEVLEKLSEKGVDGFKLLTMSEDDIVHLLSTNRVSNVKELTKHVKVLRWKILNSPINSKSSILSMVA